MNGQNWVIDLWSNNEIPMGLKHRKQWMLIDELNSGYYGPYMKKLLNKQLFTYIQNIKLDHLDNMTNLVKVATGDLPMDAEEL